MINSTMNEEPTITHIWSRLNGRWILSGALAGFLAGLIMLFIAMVPAAQIMGEWKQPLKLLGAGVFGGAATVYGPLGFAGFYGFTLHFFLSILYGVVFAQLVDEHSKTFSLVALSFVTSMIVWVFGFCLFLPSVNLSLRYATPVWFSIILHVIFGISFALILSAVRVIDKKYSSR